MSYIDTTLLANERVVYRCRPHWILFLQPIWMILAGLLFASWRLSLLSKVVLFISALQCFNQGLIYFTLEFGITTQRVIVKYGFIRRRSFENALSRVESVQVDQNVVGRLLNYGSVVVRGIGGDLLKSFILSPNHCYFVKKYKNKWKSKNNLADSLFFICSYSSIAANKQKFLQGK